VQGRSFANDQHHRANRAVEKVVESSSKSSHEGKIREIRS
jgi:hypothetical protein